MGAESPGRSRGSRAGSLRAGDLVRWTRDAPATTIRTGHLARVEQVAEDHIRFRLEGGACLALAASDPRIRHLERARDTVNFASVKDSTWSAALQRLCHCRVGSIRR